MGIFIRFSIFRRTPKKKIKEISFKGISIILNATPECAVASRARCVASLARSVASHKLVVAGFATAVASLVKFPHTSLARAVL